MNDCITNDHRMTGSTTIDEALREVISTNFELIY